MSISFIYHFRIDQMRKRTHTHAHTHTCIHTYIHTCLYVYGYSRRQVSQVNNETDFSLLMFLTASKRIMNILNRLSCEIAIWRIERFIINLVGFLRFFDVFKLAGCFSLIAVTQKELRMDYKITSMSFYSYSPDKCTKKIVDR